MTTHILIVNTRAEAEIAAEALRHGPYPIEAFIGPAELGVNRNAFAVNVNEALSPEAVRAYAAEARAALAFPME